MDGARPRAATVELINGLVFGLGIVTLLQGVTLLMRDAKIEPAAVKVARFATVVAFPVLAVYFVAQGASDTAVVRAGMQGRGCVAAIPEVGLWLTATAAFILTVSLAKPVQQRLIRYTKMCQIVAPLTVFVAATAATMVSGELGIRTPTFLMSPLALNLFLGAAALLMTIVGLMFSAAGATEPPSSRADRDLPAGTQRAMSTEAPPVPAERSEMMEPPTLDVQRSLRNGDSGRSDHSGT
jgi:hypothetical protein